VLLLLQSLVLSLSLSLSLLFKDEEGICRKKKEEALVYQSGNINKRE
jgi:hypothetical protein